MFAGLLDAETIEILVYLSSGVVAFAVLQGLHPQRTLSRLGALLMILVFAVFVDYTIQQLGRHLPLSDDIGTSWIVASSIAIVIAVLLRADFPFKLLRKWKLTDQSTEFPTPWEAAFAMKTGFVALRFKNSHAVITGYPTQWDDEYGWIRLERVAWLSDPPAYLGDNQVEAMLVRVEDVETPIEFVGKIRKEES